MPSVQAFDRQVRALRFPHEFLGSKVVGGVLSKLLSLPKVVQDSGQACLKGRVDRERGRWIASRQIAEVC